MIQFARLCDVCQTAPTCSWGLELVSRSFEHLYFCPGCGREHGPVFAPSDDGFPEHLVEVVV